MVAKAACRGNRNGVFRLAKGANPRFVVTNIPGDARELYQDVYCQRGEMENCIKEQQLDLFTGRTSCHRFLANQFSSALNS
jgi:Transposase DDE domain group 1